MVESRNLLGRGTQFPLSKSPSGGLSYTEDIQRINQSLFLIFETPKGDRLMLPEFGSGIHKYRFDPLDRELMERLRYTITKDIERWEPRVTLTGIDFLADDNSIDESTLYISISYTLINSAVAGNYVYPYKRSTYDTSEKSYE